MKTPTTIEGYKEFVRKKLDELLPIFSQASIGDFSVNTTIPEKEDEFTSVFVGVQLIVEVVREQLAELQQLNHNLEKKVKERTAEIAAKTIRAEKAEMARKVAEMFLTNMSHEIRTPMNAILGYANLVDNSELSAEQKKFVQIILKSGNHLLGIINDILDLSKLESGKIDFEKKNLSIHNVISSVTEIISEKANNRKNKLLVSIDPRLKKEVAGDAMRLQQIFLNLLSNAIKFTAGGKIYITASLTAEGKNSKDVFFEVKDTGCGIPESELPFIFDRLRSLNDFSNINSDGTGIGLAIVKQLVEQQEGKISVVSKYGKGTSFQFTLRFSNALKISPVSFSPAATKADSKNVLKIYQDDLLRRRKTILVVEDNPVNMELVKILLEKWKMEFSCAVDGKEALQKVKLDKPGLILLDLKLPDIDGHEIAKRIRKMKNIPQPLILALTAHAIEGERKKCLQSGMDDFMSKPFVPEALRLQINKLIQNDSASLPAKAISKNKRGRTGSFIDLGYLSEITGNDKKEVKRLVDLFIKNATVLLKEIENYSEKGNYSRAIQSIHKLKSGASTVLIKKHLTRIEKIENSFDDKNKTGKRIDMDELQLIIFGAISELKALSKKNILQTKN